MTYIEQAIGDAVEKGGYSLKMVREMPVACIQCIFLDPLFWQALGKALGWPESGAFYECPNGCRNDEIDYPTSYSKEGWRFWWHRFIDHLAEGKDAESLFAEIYKT